MAINVVLAEDSYLMREGLRSILELIDDVQLVAACDDYASLLAAVDEHEPDVVITDIRMPPTQSDEGIRAALEIRSRHPETGVVVLSQYAEPEYALKLFSDGSSGRAYLLKERVGDIDTLSAAITEVSGGGSRMDPQIVDVLVRARLAAQSPLNRLTPRELEVLAEMAKGLNNAAVADELFISQRSVEKHINSIFAKLDLSPEESTHRRVQAVLLYLGDHDG